MENFLLEKEKKDRPPNGPVMLDDITRLRFIANETSRKIMEFLQNGPSYAEEIARKLRIDRQKIHYRIRKLESAGLIRVVDIKNINGSLAKIYSPVSGTIGLSFVPAGSSPQLVVRNYSIEETVFSDFIENGVLNGLICVGSPFPHGQFRAISRDTSYAVYLGMHIGNLAHIPPHFPVILDSQVISRNSLGENLVLVGGPVSNTVTMRINDSLPVSFRKEAGWAINDHGSTYTAPSIGLIEEIVNPYDPGKRILVVAGNSNQGTLSAILGATKFWKQIFQNDFSEKRYFLLQGYDDDSDGVVDSVERIY